MSSVRPYISVRRDCRACRGDLEDVLDLGVQKTISLGDKESIGAPLVLTKCKSCHLVQLRHTVDRDFLFKTYYYRSGATQTMRDHLKELVEDINKRVPLKVNDIMVDIGSNDGTLLSFYDQTLIRVGFDPAKIPYAQQACDFVKVEEFFSAKTFSELTKDYFGFEDRKAQVVTAIACFYDLDDPNAFLQDVKKVLAPDGLFVLQVNYLPDTLTNNAVGDIVHEHLEYYTLETLQYLLNRNGFIIADTSKNDINGGSIRVFAKHGVMDRPIVEPSDWATLKPYEDFGKRIALIAQKLKGFIETVQLNGKKVAVVGASTRGGTLLQYAGLTKFGHINWIVERDASKVGKRYLSISIISEEEDKANPADFYLLMPTWFQKEIQARMPWVKNWIVPLPEPTLNGEPL